MKMPAFEWVHVQLHQQKGMISLSPPTICNSAITETDNAWLYSLSNQTNDTGESEWIHFTGSGYLLRTDAWSYPVLRLKRLGLSRTFRRLVVTLIRRYGVSLIHLDAGAECLQDLPTFNW
ncbi:hypothetical protein EFK62_26520 [Escherichia coli]|nr:hypothetical protein [Escherichia coli]